MFFGKDFRSGPVVLWVIMVLVVLILVRQIAGVWQQLFQREECLSQELLIGNALSMYLSDFDSHLPINFNSLAWTEWREKAVTDVPICPSAPRDKWAYRVNTKLEISRSTDNLSPFCPVLWDGKKDLPFPGVDYCRHRLNLSCQGANILFFDGHAESAVENRWEEEQFAPKYLENQ